MKIGVRNVVLVVLDQVENNHGKPDKERITCSSNAAACARRHRPWYESGSDPRSILESVF